MGFWKPPSQAELPNRAFELASPQPNTGRPASQTQPEPKEDKSAFASFRFPPSQVLLILSLPFTMCVSTLLWYLQIYTCFLHPKSVWNFLDTTIYKPTCTNQLKSAWKWLLWPLLTLLTFRNAFRERFVFRKPMAGFMPKNRAQEIDKRIHGVYIIYIYIYNVYMYINIYVYTYCVRQSWLKVQLPGHLPWALSTRVFATPEETYLFSVSMSRNLKPNSKNIQKSRSRNLSNLSFDIGHCLLLLSCWCHLFCS